MSARSALALAVEVPQQEPAEDFKRAMRRLTSTVSIIATGVGGSRCGMVATAVSSLCTDPPSLLICINRSASLYQPLLANQRFSVNLLDAAQSSLVGIFAGQLKGPARFEHGDWDAVDDLPYLSDAQATLFCRVDARLTYATHEVIVGRVERSLVTERISPLLWQDGKPAQSCELIH
ncbi:flavin reductase family protein [Pseudomonas frederiksbergensis]|uniref:Flavin reductase n=1 Tax=Pseudomonas frederiksbergensis TaxID=104087 RepID=A0A423KN94_9PSED|nr:flavin reductase family protein [Pseudomonas frederiksbergensis]RON55855.1 flavin reductase [Pseudomonas frederiksbergensis]